MLISILVISFAATMVGGLVPKLAHLLTRERLSRTLALRSGLLLAVAFGDILPKAWSNGPHLAGLAAFAAFALCYAAEYFAMGDTCHEALEDCRLHSLGTAALIGILAHSFVDGVNIGAARLAGINTLIAAGIAVIVCHFADGFTLTTLFVRSGFRRNVVTSFLAAVGLSTAAGAGLANATASGLAPSPTALLLGFAGGCFVYVGAADIIPRLHRDRDPAALSFFAAGAAAMAGLHAFFG